MPRKLLAQDLAIKYHIWSSWRSLDEVIMQYHGMYDIA